MLSEYSCARGMRMSWQKDRNIFLTVGTEFIPLLKTNKQLDFILRAVLGWQKSRVNSTEISHILPAPTLTQPLHLQNLHQSKHVCYNLWTDIDTALSSRVSVLTLRFSLGDACSMDLDKYKIPCFYRYSIVKNTFPAPPPQILSARLSHTALPTIVDSFVFIAFVFSGVSCSWNHIVCILFRLAFFHIVICN